MLAIVYALNRWQHYLYEVEFVIYIDHHSLKFWLTQDKVNSRQARWLEFLQEFHFEVRYRNGKINVVADALSRFPLEVNTIQLTWVLPDWTKELAPLYT